MFKICAKILIVFIVLGADASIAEELSEQRKSKPYPLVPRHTYSGGEKEPHCELWSLERALGKAGECRRRATRPSEGKIKCRFKRSFPNKDDPELLMCVYERAGYKLDDMTISSEGGLPCVKEFLCKQ